MMLGLVPQFSPTRIGWALWLLLRGVWEERRHRAELDQLGWLSGTASLADL